MKISIVSLINPTAFTKHSRILHLLIFPTLSIQILNAGVALTKRYMTEDNLELHMASNHFGHFLLANLLAPLMVRSAAGQGSPGRVVTVSSLGHWWGKIELDNLNSER